jgi:hypothetical protein
MDTMMDEPGLNLECPHCGESLWSKVRGKRECVGCGFRRGDTMIEAAADVRAAGRSLLNSIRATFKRSK